MSGLLRPTFSEGQILGAADLNAQVTYDRLGAVLHERSEHLWGVAQGLALTTTPNSDSSGNKFINVSVSPGRAVDRLGRSIVVSAAVPLDPSAFKQQIANRDKTKSYPVFVQAIEVPQVGGDTQPGKCGVTLTTRIEESQQVSFGTPGSEISILDQEAATVDEGFGTPSLSDKVLVGWVQFDQSISGGQFIAVASQANGIGVRYVGVVASDVVAGGGVLTLHTRPDGQRFMLSITENSTGGCLLAFGKQDGTNSIVPTFSVDEKGNIKYAGVLDPAPVAKTLADSGVISDGAKIQLPLTVTDQDISNGVRLHVALIPFPQSPRQMLLPIGGLKLAYPMVTRCDVDVTDDSIVHSRVRWYDPTNASDSIDIPGPCTYTVIATGK